MSKRDPEAVIAALRKVLARWPLLRVGQAISNSMPESIEDPFYVEDSDMARMLSDFADSDR